ncbi:MAG TPA: hypothetical protein VGZ93_04985 [Candidatus Methylacidiphilales bacterium]|jgi:hypothetical protein|nr:hypothetical protein [Candidatus Methylacidiphilales bacterium]
MTNSDHQMATQLQVYKKGATAHIFDDCCFSYDAADRKLIIHSSKSGEVGSFSDATPGETAYGESRGTDFIFR